MKSFVVTIDPSSFDLHKQSPPLSLEEQDQELNLKRLWTAFNSKAHKLLQQGTRIDNLFWRRWHLEQKALKEKQDKEKEMNSHHHVQYPSPSHYGHSHSHSNGIQQNGGGMSHYERLNEAGRQATRDLEAFLSNTLQAAQPPTIPNPPTFPPVPPSPYSQLQQNLTNASPSVPHAQYPSPAPPPPPQHIIAPQPHRPLQQQYAPSPEWAYNALPPPPSMTSQPPSMPPVSSSQSRIIATPSWTALISDSMPHPSMTSSTIPHLYPQPTAPPPQQQPYPYPPTYPHQPQHNPYSYVTPSLAHPQPMHPASFTLPPSATLFSDVTSALSSAPHSTAPPAFYSSYGVYQPIHTPYPRFLTPSPEPSILGELDLDGIGTSGVADYESVIGGGNVLNGIQEEGGGDEEMMDSVWSEFSPVENQNPSSLPNSVTSNHSVGTEDKRDPFEGMSLAQIRSRANSVEAVDRDERRYESFGRDSGLNASDRAAFEVLDQRNGGVKGKSKRKNSTDSNGGVIGNGKKTNLNGGSPYIHDSQPLHLDSTSPTLSSTADESSPPEGGGVGQKSANALLGKKNRNPHATQLPGNGQRKLPKEEAGEGHQGPICSHCASITTPLWRRGPDDELLCNACGLYLKLHSKPRPKTFGKGASGTKRSMNGAAAKAAASGVPPVCSNCACTSTPMWRVLEGKLSCNACSLYFKLHKVPRPASLAQKRAAAAAAKVNLAAAAASTDGNPPSTTSSPGDRPATLEPVDTQTPSTSTASTLGGGEAQTTSPSTSSNAPLQPAVMPPPHSRTHNQGGGMMLPPSLPPPSSHTPQNWPRTATTSPYLEASLGLSNEPNPFAQTSWGALAYQLVSAAAEEEAGQGDPGGTGGGGLNLSETNGDATSSR